MSAASNTSNTSGVRSNTTVNTPETLSLRAAAELVGVAPSTLAKHKTRLIEAGSRRVGSPPRWEITREQLERAGFTVEHLEHHLEHPECSIEQPRTPLEHDREHVGEHRSSTPDWAELWRAERQRAERAEAALAEERRRVDALTGSLVMAMRRLEQRTATRAEEAFVTVEPEVPRTEEPTPTPRPWWHFWGRRSS